MHIKNNCLVVLSFGLWASAFGATDGNYYSDANRELFISPKSAAMGGADVSFLRSAQPLSNPSNLAVDSLKEVSLAYAGYFQNTFSISALSFMSPVDSRSGFGVSISYRYIPGIELSSDPALGVDRTAASTLFFFRAGYGRSIVRFSNQMEIVAGAAINGERRDNVDLTGYGIGMDVGANFLVKDIGFSAGMVVENATSSYIRWDSAYKSYAYPHARLGLGWQYNIPYIYGKICAGYVSPDLFGNEGINAYTNDSLSTTDGYSTSTTDVASPQMKSIYKNPLMLILGQYGLEYAIIDRLAFRVGYSSATNGFSFGAGLHLLQNHAGIDFAYLTHELAPTYKISVNFKWL